MTENRVPRRSSFVGRARELDQLQAAFETAASGQGALVMLVGEPGIGKTAVCEQLCSFVEASGGTPLVGHCYEEGSFRPPYQPFVEVFGTYLQECDTDALLADLGSGGADLARMLPVLNERFQVAPAVWRSRRGPLAVIAGCDGLSAECRRSPPAPASARRSA